MSDTSTRPTGLLGKMNSTQIYFRKPRIRPVDVAWFCRTISTSLQTGLGLRQALNAVARRRSSKPIGQRASTMLDRYVAGERFGTIMEDYVDEFGSLTVALVQASEESADLANAMSRAAELLETRLRLRREIVTAAIYPSMVLILTSTIFTIMLVFIVPQFASLFKEFNATLPLPTRIIIGLSHVLLYTIWTPVVGPIHFPTLPFILIGAFVLGRRTLRLPEVKYRMDRFKVRIPIFGDVLYKGVMSRVATTLASLLAARDINIPTAVYHAGRTAENKFYEEKLEQVRVAVRSGIPLSTALEQSHGWDPELIEVVLLGEETSELDVVLDRYAKAVADDMTRSVERIKGVMEPLMMLFVGGVIGSVLLSLYQPLLQLSSKVQ